MGAITDIFRTFSDAYLHTFPNIPRSHRKTINAICHCRSGEYGVTIYTCQDCNQRHFINCSCGNRHCPQCQYHKSQNWLANQLAKQLPGHHFMITFTVPDTIRRFIRSNQRIAYSALFKASADALKTLAKNQRFIGTDLPGFTGVLHTWGRQLQYHPHIHYIVPGGGLDKNRTHWLTSHKSFYVPVKALSRIFQAKFKTLMKEHGIVSQIDQQVWQRDWNVNVKPVENAEASLKYLTPYIFRVAISDKRIVAVKGRKVTFNYLKKDSKRPRKITLDAFEFIRRFLQHVLPTGFMKVRHFGFMNANCAVNIAELRSMIMNQMKNFVLLFKDRAELQIERPTPRCSSCKGQLLYAFSLIPRRPYRGPG